MRKVSPEQVEEIAKLRDLGVSIRKSSKLLGIPVSTVAEYWLAIKKKESPKGEGPITRKESGDDCTLEFAIRKRVVTLEDAIAYAQVDLAIWYVDRFDVVDWEMGYKNAENVAESLPLHRVKMYLKRVLPKSLLQATEAIFKRLEEKAPVVFDRPICRPKPKSVMMEINIADAHMAKLCWGPETGTNYDLRLAEEAYENAVEDLCGLTSQFDVGQIVMPIGNDFFHVDTMAGTTTSGTPVDSDGRYAKMIEVGEMAVIRAIERLAKDRAPVHVIWVPGNHDHLASFHLCRTIAAWFRNDKHVTVDHTPIVRKYHVFGTTLNGYTHGNDVPARNLPIIMATERPHDWAATTCREWKLGHFHTSKKFETIPVESHNGVACRFLPSIGGTDSWHFAKGFIGNRRAAETYLYGYESGYIGHFQCEARHSG
jgi:hypothetical protein